MIPFLYYIVDAADAPALSQDVDVFTNLIDLGMNAGELVRQGQTEFTNDYTGERLKVELCPAGTFLIRKEGTV